MKPTCMVSRFLAWLKLKAFQLNLRLKFFFWKFPKIRGHIYRIGRLISKVKWRFASKKLNIKIKIDTAATDKMLDELNSIFDKSRRK